MEDTMSGEMTIREASEAWEADRADRGALTSLACAIAAEYLGQRGYTAIAVDAPRARVTTTDTDGTVAVMAVSARDAGDPQTEPTEAAASEEAREMLLAWLGAHPGYRSARADLLYITILGGGTAHMHHVVGAAEWQQA